MIGGGLGSALGSGFSGGDPSGGLSSAASAYGLNKLNGSLNGFITSSGAGAKNESIYDSLSQTPSYYRQGLSYGSLKP